MSEQTYRIEYVRRGYQIKLSDDDKRYLERVENPQDLLDGLLSVEYDEIKTRLFADAKRLAEADVIRALFKAHNPPA